VQRCNVYLNEADEWSERLGEVLQQWSQEPAAAIPDDAIALAHSLAGSSGTVGFKALSELARLLEHALLHLQPQGYASALQIQQCVTASDEVRRLLHQFAAGFSRTLYPLSKTHCVKSEYPIDAGAAAETADLELSDLAELDEAEWPEVQALQPPADPRTCRWTLLPSFRRMGPCPSLRVMDPRVWPRKTWSIGSRPVAGCRRKPRSGTVFHGACRGQRGA
jgi:chemosensory pili system protein ChpA (sensor histidine kinase/response regulator)